MHARENARKTATHARGIAGRRPRANARTRARTHARSRRRMQWNKRRVECETAKVAVRSDTQRRDRERTLTRDNESCAGFQEDHRETVELRICLEPTFSVNN